MKREIIFNHQGHFERGTACRVCHLELSKDGSSTEVALPAMIICLECHDGSETDNTCELCHERVVLADIHPAGWKHSHGDRR